MEETCFSIHDDGRVVFRYGEIGAEPPFEVEIHCPLPSVTHSKKEKILEQHRDWARSFNIPPGDESYKRYCDTRFDLLAAFQFYDLPLDAAVVASHLMTWFFVFDDVMDIDHGLENDVRIFTGKVCKRHLEMLGGAVTSDDDPRCLQAFSDYLQKVRQLCGDGSTYWYDRMVHHLREYVLGAYWESLIGPTTEANTNTAMYLQVRHMAVGVAPCHDLMALAAGIPGEPLKEDFFIRRLERMAINYSIWVNDLAGLGRDLKRGLGNIIFTLQRDHSLSLTEATRMVARMCDAELDAFLQVEQQLPMLLGDDYNKNREAYDAYTGVLKKWMRGLLDWSARSDRYQRLDVDMALQNDSLIRHTSQNYLSSSNT